MSNRRSPTSLASEWTVAVHLEGEVFVEAGVPTLAGAARLEFDDGSFVDVDPDEPGRLLALLAVPGSTGWWLLSSFTDTEFAKAAIAEQIPERCVTAAAPPRTEAHAIGRAALISHLSAHDRASRRLTWQLEMLAQLARSATVGQHRLSSLPVGVDLVAAAQRALDLVERWPSLAADRSAFLQLLERAHDFPVDDDEYSGLLKRSIAKLEGPAVESAGQDHYFSYADRGDDRDAFRMRGDGLLVLSAESSRVGDADTMPVLAVDRGWLPKNFELALDSSVQISREGTRCRIELAGVTDPPKLPLYARVYDPDTSSPLLGITDVDIKPFNYDAEAGVLAATIDLIPSDFANGSGKLLVEIVDSVALLKLPPTYVEYFAGATRSDLAILRLYSMEPDRYGRHATKTVHERILASAGELSEEARQEAERLAQDTTIVLGFVTPRIDP